jgi:hypothetical protein
MLKGSFVENNIMFEMSRDGVFENGRAWNIETGEYVPVEGLRESSLRASKIVDASDYILNNNLLSKEYGNNALIVNSYTRPEPDTATDSENEDSNKQEQPNKDVQGGSTRISDKGQTGQTGKAGESRQTGETAETGTVDAADVEDKQRDSTGSGISEVPGNTDADGISGGGGDSGAAVGSGGGINPGTDGVTDDSSGVSWISEPVQGVDEGESVWKGWQEEEFWFLEPEEKMNESNPETSREGAEANEAAGSEE